MKCQRYMYLLKVNLFPSYILQLMNVYLISKQLNMLTKIRDYDYLNGCLISSDGGGETPGYSCLQGG